MQPTRSRTPCQRLPRPETVLQPTPWLLQESRFRRQVAESGLGGGTCLPIPPRQIDPAPEKSFGHKYL